MRTKTVSLFFILFTSLATAKPSTELDSLLGILKKHNSSDTMRANNLLKCAFYYRQNNTDSSFYFTNEAFSISKRIKYDFGIIYSYNNLGTLNRINGNLNLALQYFLKAAAMGNTKDSMVMHGVALAINNIGVLHESIGEYYKAIDFLKRAIAIDSSLKYTRGIARENGNLGKAYLGIGDFDNAKKHLDLSLKQYTQDNFKFGIVECITDIGRLNALEGNDNIALHYFYKSISINKASYLAGDAYTYHYLAKSLFSLGYIDSALYYQQKSFDISDKIDYKDLICESAYQLSALYEIARDYKKANWYKSKYIELNNFLSNQKITAQLSELKSRYDDEKKQKEIAFLHKQQAKISFYNNHLIKLRNGLFILLSLCILLIVVIYKAYRDKRRVNKELMLKFGELRAKKEEINIKSQEIINKNHLISISNSILQRQRLQLTEAQRIGKLGSWEFNPHTKRYSWSNYLFELFDLPKSEVPPSFTKCIYLINKNDRFIVISAIRHVITNRTKVKFQFRLYEEVSHQKFVNAKIVPMIDSSNELILVSGTLLDTSEYKTIEGKLMEAKEQAEIANKSKSIFLANISHEIRTPLNGIIGFTNLLFNICSEPQQKEYIKLIRSSGDSLLGLLNDILDFNKIEHGKLDVEEIDFQLHETIDFSLQTYRMYAKEKGIDFSVNISPEVPLWVKGDPLRTRQIIVNYVSNALKFTEHGKIKINVSIEEINIPEGDKLKLRFNVADTGIGVPFEKQKHIFDLFTQLDSSTTREYGGSGLGLAITYQLAKLLGGNTGVISPGSLCDDKNPGADFWFTMQVKRSINPKAELNNLDNRQARFSRRMKALVAEDNLVNQLLMKKVLENMNCDTKVVENGLLAVEEIAREKYDFILMDIQMPVMDGYQATMVIRQTENASIPIIGVSANVFKEDIEKCFTAGMDAHVSKPFKPVDLYNSIQNIFKSKVC